MLFAGWEVCIGKTCALTLEYGLRPYSRPRAQFFLMWSDQGQCLLAYVRFWHFSHKSFLGIHNYLILYWTTTFYVVLWCKKKLEKLLKLEISKQSVLGIQMGKSGPLKCVQLANQIQRFRILDCWEAGEKKFMVSSITQNITIGAKSSLGRALFIWVSKVIMQLLWFWFWFYYGLRLAE